LEKLETPRPDYPNEASMSTTQFRLVVIYCSPLSADRQARGLSLPLRCRDCLATLAWNTMLRVVGYLILQRD